MAQIFGGDAPDSSSASSLTESLEAAVRWAIPLDEPPHVVHAGICVHGLHGPERYLLDDLWSLHLYQYETTLRAGRRVFTIRPGYASVMPPRTPLEYLYSGRSQHLFVLFRTSAVPEGRSSASVTAVQDLGSDFERWRGLLAPAFSDPATPDYALRALTWSLLWRLSASSATTTATIGEPLPVLRSSHPAVTQAVQRIESRLAETLSVSEIARAVNVTPGYLARLFQEALGTTVVGYIRSRRLQRARQLIVHSTLPVKAVAASVGIPDLHAFNKAMRREFGFSPRLIRNENQRRMSTEV